MPKFSYQAITQSGNTVSGVIEAESLETAKNALADQGYIPSKVKAIEGGSKGESRGGMMEALTRVKVADLILFSKQFRTLIRAGIPIVDLFQVLESQTENVKLKKIIGSMGLSVRSGSTLRDAFRRHPRVFSPLYCSMIRAGEMSGSLPAVLDRLIYIIEHEDKIKAETDLNVEALSALLDEGFDELSELGDFDLVKINDGNASIRISIEAG